MAIFSWAAQAFGAPVVTLVIVIVIALVWFASQGRDD